MAAGLRRPFAEIDRKSFLTMMSLLRIKWKGEDTRDVLTGAGRFFEITAAEIVNVGVVYQYNPSKTRGSQIDAFQPTRYIVGSEKARSAMFHCFDLGFYTFRTHTAEEASQGLTAFSFVDSDVPGIVHSYMEGNNGWAPGLADAIVCWGEASMPKAIDDNTNRYVSVYSQTPTGTCFGDTIILTMLSTDGPSQSPKEATVKNWIQAYLRSLDGVGEFFDDGEKIHQEGEQIHRMLQWALDQYAHAGDRMATTIPWNTVSQQCLALIHSLDDHLEALIAGHNTHIIKSRFAGRQISYMCRLFADACDVAGHSSWRDHIHTVVARNYVRVGEDLGSSFVTPAVAEKLVANRMLRGALWCIHNAWDRDPSWRLCCTLSSQWLTDDSTVFIA